MKEGKAPKGDLPYSTIAEKRSSLSRGSYLLTLARGGFLLTLARGGFLLTLARGGFLLTLARESTTAFFLGTFAGGD